ncbi:putative membrane protein [Acinetobacter baumannii]|uniref:Putative membrane protein n=1 Tax=Acinetobacter baumannii TaxID=470 RepID=A0A7U7KEL6_ACIBA|nr:attS domain protein [Acinetobacter baumannii 233846]CDM72320.1 hypothetical protein ABP630_1873 [Acinetobacter baumannii P630]CRL94597.1 putative membrane protein [Acinetobacter baumannii]CUW35279.1 putative membrane protein [Acinetobacter baumannii]
MLPNKKKNIALCYILPLILVVGFYAFFRVSILPYIYTKQAEHQLLTANNQTTEIYWKEPDLLANKKVSSNYLFTWYSKRQTRC